MLVLSQTATVSTNKMLSIEILQLLSVFLLHSGLAAPLENTYSETTVRVAHHETYVPLMITADGRLSNWDGESDAMECFYMFHTLPTTSDKSSDAPRPLTFELGQGTKPNDHVITAYSDGSVDAGHRYPSDAMGSGDDSMDYRNNRVGYTKFYTEGFGPAQLKMEIEGEEKCLSFASSAKRDLPMMVECSRAETFEIYPDDCL